MNIDNWVLVLLAGSVVMAGCDIEDRLRSVMYDEPESATPVGESEEETRERQTVTPGERAEEAFEVELSQQMDPIFAELDSGEQTHWYGIQSDDGETQMAELSVTPEDSELDIVIHLEVPGSDEPALRYDIADAGETEEVPMLAIPGDEPRRISISGADSSQGSYRIELRQRLTAATVAMAPNDVPELATTLDVPGEVQGFYDRPHDRDVFFVPAESLRAGVYSLEVGAVPGLTQQLQIYGDRELDEAIMEIGVSEDRPAVIPNLSLSADEDEQEGLYFVLTSGEEFDREQGYRLRLIEHPDLGDDEFTLEREPNDTPGTAQAVDFQEPIRGYFHTASDVDRYRLTIEDDEEDDDGDEEDDDAEDDEEDYDEYDGRLGASDDDPEEDDADEDDEPEVFDPWAPVEDKEAPEYVVQTRVTPLSEAHRIGVRWIPGEDTGEESVELHADDSDEELVVCNRIIGPGEYDIELRATDSDASFRPRSYDYELEVLNIAEKPGLEIEPNDDLGSADRLEMGQSRTGFIATEGDVDVFAFVVGPDEPQPMDDDVDDDSVNGDDVAELTDDTDGVGDVDDEDDAVDSGGWEAPETETVTLLLEGNPLDLGFELLDDEEGRVALVDDAGPGSDEELQIDLPHGLYYVAVRADSGAVCEPYEIEVMTR